MRLKTGKAISKYLRTFIFLLLLLKGAFPLKAVYAQSTTACLVNPVCSGMLASELGSTIATPTGAGFGASTLSVTTSSGATTALVRAATGVAVVGGAAATGYAVWHYWDQATNEQAQNKAKERYCTAYPGDVVCGIWDYGGYGFKSNGSCQADIARGVVRRQKQAALLTTFSIRHDGINCTGTGFKADGVSISSSNGTNVFYPGSIFATKRQPLDWKDWSQAKHDAAVALLNNTDWQQLRESMPAGGVLEGGHTINGDTIIIPGQETDVPSTPADERLLKKEEGFFTWPGFPDFDKDGFPDETDPDDDNDRTLEPNDPAPYNPNVPVAINTEDEGDEVTPEVLQDIGDIINSYKPDENLKCVECAGQIETYLKSQGISGRRVILDTTRKVKEDDLILDDSVSATEAISINGHHEGIAIRINGEEKVFDNHHPDGVPYEQWKNNLTFYSKEFSGEYFKESGYLF